MDTWHSLVKVTREVTGEVFVRLVLSETATGLDELTATVVGARDLSVSDLFTLFLLFLAHCFP